MSIRKPAANRYGVLGMEYVRGGGVVDNDGVFQVSPDLGKILYVVALVVVTTLAEQTVVDNLVDIELVQ